MTYDIIIPVLNNWELTAACLLSIQQYSGGDQYRIIYIDNGSDPEETEKILPLLKYQPHIFIKNAENLGWVKAINQGLKVSTADYIVLMNNDTEAAPGWLQMLAAPLTSNKVGLAGPLTDNKNQWQGNGSEKTGYVILPDNRPLAFFCVMMTRRTFEIIGYLDNDFSPGFGDDDYYNYLCNEAGLERILVCDLVIKHHHRSTFKRYYSPEEIKKLLAQANKIYQNKKQ